jgi:galactokinase
MIPMSHPAPAFHALFARDPELAADAPGRVNLIGEHTDYNDGLVLPTATPQRCRVELACRDDERVRVASAAVEGAVAEYRLGAEGRQGAWIDYVQGCTQALALAGERVGGFDARIASQVPMGAGVSSSAALEVSLLRALRDAFALALDDAALARVAHAAEHDFVGAHVGIMDQMAASLADERTALFLDVRTVRYERLPLPSTADLVVVDSGVRHAHADGGYNDRRAECERAAALLGIATLRDVTEADVDRIAGLPPPLDRRVRHVITENARVVEAVAALRAGDVARLGALFAASHASLRDDFEVSTPEVEILIGVARDDPAVYGARLTGGGFGGAVVMLAAEGEGAAAAARIADAYGRRAGRAGTVLVPAGGPDER